MSGYGILSLKFLFRPRIAKPIFLFAIASQELWGTFQSDTCLDYRWEGGWCVRPTSYLY